MTTTRHLATCNPIRGVRRALKTTPRRVTLAATFTRRMTGIPTTMARVTIALNRASPNRTLMVWAITIQPKGADSHRWYPRWRTTVIPVVDPAFCTSAWNTRSNGTKTPRSPIASGSPVTFWVRRWLGSIPIPHWTTALRPSHNRATSGDTAKRGHPTSASVRFVGSPRRTTPGRVGCTSTPHATRCHRSHGPRCCGSWAGLTPRRRNGGRLCAVVAFRTRRTLRRSPESPCGIVTTGGAAVAITTC